MFSGSENVLHYFMQFFSKIFSRMTVNFKSYDPYNGQIEIKIESKVHYPLQVGFRSIGLIEVYYNPKQLRDALIDTWEFQMGKKRIYVLNPTAEINFWVRPKIGFQKAYVFFFCKKISSFGFSIPCGFYSFDKETLNFLEKKGHQLKSS